MKPQLENISISKQSSIHIIYTDTDDFDAPWHYHPEYEITLILKGKGIRFVGDNAEKYDDNDLVALAPNIPHHWKSNTDYSISQAIIIQFKEEVFGEAFWSLSEMVEIKDLFKKMKFGLRFVITNEVIALMNSMRDSEGIDRLNQFISLLSALSKLDQNTLISLNYFETATNPVKSRLDQIYLLVNKHFKEDISQKDFADKIGLTKESLSRYFKQVTQQNFINYLIEYRIAYASMLLKETNMKIVEVAYESGFNNLSNFNRQFKKIKEISPSGYKKWVK